MKRATLMAVATLALAASSSHGQVWVADFNTDGGFDGMAEFQDGNPGKDMFNPGGASGSVLQVQLEDGITFGGQHDKGGRSIGSVNPQGNSFSGYYKFAYSQLAESATELYTGVGFLGDTQVHISREFLGSVMVYKKEAGDYQVNLGGYFGGVGIGYSGYKGNSWTSLGSNPFDQMFQLVVSWDGATHVLHNALYDGNGTLLAQNIGDLDSTDDYPNLHILSQATLDADINASRMKYLGFQDWVGNATQQTVVLDTDVVAYFDTAGGAFSLVPEPTTALLLAGGLAMLARRRRGLYSHTTG